MKKLIVLIVISILSISCGDMKKHILSSENSIMEIPQNLPDQKRLDKYGIQNKGWFISQIIGHEGINKQEYFLHPIVDTVNYPYGNTVRFENNKFNSLYGAPCGNDCFPSSTGEYFFKDENYISIKVKNFKQDGDCESKNMTFNKEFVNYFIQPIDGNALRLIKSNGDLKADQQKVMNTK